MDLSLLFALVVEAEERESESLADLDRAALRRYLDGDAAAFGEFFDRHRRRLYNVVAALVGEGDGAEDVTQDAFCKFLEYTPKLDFAWAPSTLLYRIARQLAINLLRGAERRTRAQLSQEAFDALGDGAPGHADRLHRAELAACVRDAVAELEPEVRQVFLLRGEGTLTFEEIGRALGCSARTAKRYARAAADAVGARLARAGFRPEDVA